MSLRRALVCCLRTSLLVGAMSAVAAGQESLARARDLYGAAAYEDALAVLNRLQAPVEASEEARGIQQYRAFCLLALGRNQEAERAIESVVAAEPSYQPSASEASPRIRAAFRDVRRRMLPGIIQSRYGQAKAAFDGKDFVGAHVGFKYVIDLLADPDVQPVASQPPLSDLRTLAMGFRDLSASASTPPPLPVAPVAAPEPPPAPLRPLRPPVPRVYSAEDGDVVPPGVVRQTVPPFPGRSFTPGQGTLSVVVDERGAVESASMLVPVNPTYDRLIVEAAKQWRYKPATLDGVPVKYRRILQISLEPAK